MMKCLRTHTYVEFRLPVFYHHFWKAYMTATFQNHCIIELTNSYDALLLLEKQVKLFLFS